MEILTRSKCETCKGEGMYTNPLWQEFFKIEEENGYTWEMDKVEQWFRDRGYSKLPPEELYCEDCEGKRVIQKWIVVDEKFMTLITN